MRKLFCDFHSHAYGPYTRFPSAKSRTFEPPESSIESLEAIWKENGIERAVMIQGSAYGTDHATVLHAIARDPEQRRGIAILPLEVSPGELHRLDQGGIRGVRFNWVSICSAKQLRLEPAL
jgi:2-pyrone-4,6-dicarboxylate lactonase